MDDDEYGFCPNCGHENIHLTQLGEMNGKVCCYYCYEQEVIELDVITIKNKIAESLMSGSRLRSFVLMPMFKKYSVDEYDVLKMMIEDGIVKDERCILTLIKEPNEK